MDGVKDGTIKIKSGEFPSFLYPSGVPFDPNNRGRGLLRGEALVCVSKKFQYALLLLTMSSLVIPPPLHRCEFRRNRHLPQGHQEEQGRYTWRTGTLTRDYCLFGGSR